MIKKGMLCSVLAAMLLSFYFYPSPAHSGIFDMFSFLFKKPAPSSVNDIIGSELKPVTSKVNGVNFTSLSSFDDNNRREVLHTQSFNLSIDRVVVTGQNAGLPILEKTDFIAVSDRDAYIIQGRNFPSTAIANGYKTDRIAKVFLTNSNFTVEKKLDSQPLNSDQEFVYISQLEALPGQFVMTALAIRSEGTKTYQLQMFDLNKQTFDFVANIEGSTAGDKSYFEVLAINNEAALVAYFTDQKREKAEFYHNYYQHIMLFNTTYPKGIEIAKLGIDDGNLLEWAIKDKVLYMNTYDNRNLKKKEKHYSWSLNLSRLLTK